MQPRIIIDFPGGGKNRNLLAFGVPGEILCATTTAQVSDVLLEAEARAMAGAWVAGMVNYEAAPAFDPSMKICSGGSLPLAWFGVFDNPLPFSAADSHQAFPPCESWSPGTGRQQFDRHIAAIRDAILEGDVYQINYTMRMHSRFTGNDLELFSRLQSAQPDSYAAYLNLGRWRILSVSPELFFHREGSMITAKPMKGTAQRGRWPDEDRMLADNLRSSAKNRAENLMIVDLLRNDLARIAQPDTVRVPSLFSVEQHPTLLQMTSTITAVTRPGTSLSGIFSALFPCGSVTGAPKIKAMELIASLEAEPRGAYCGAIGLIRPGGDATFNVAIRTVTIDAENETASCGIGSGIVWDSTAPDEYAETLLKSRFLDVDRIDFDLFETLRLEGGRYMRLELHLARLAASAHYFGRSLDLARCRSQLEEFAAGTIGEPAARVRIRVDRTGKIGIEAFPVPKLSGQPAVFSLANEAVNSGCIWLYHKTTRREIYERAAAQFPDAYDVLLWNERGELTEFTRGNLVLDIDNRRLTPAIDSGLLNGCMRQEMLDRGEIIEATLLVEDLARAQRIWFINSLRGSIEMRQHHGFSGPAQPDDAGGLVNNEKSVIGKLD